MPISQLSFEVKGMDELVKQLNKAEVDIKRATESALKASKQAVNPGIKSAMAKHHDTGKTEASLDTSMMVKWDENDNASIDIGFHVRKGGLPSIFLMYGTPRHAPKNQYGYPKRQGAKYIPAMDDDKELYNSIYGQDMKIAKIQEQVLHKVLERAIRGK